MKLTLKSLHRLLRRHREARKLGFCFFGTSRFTIPKTITFADKSIKLHLPAERGLASDLINVILDDEYGLRLLKNVPNTVVDVGANVGFFSLWTKALFPDAKVHAYEPNEALWPYTQANLDQMGVSLFREAVASKSGRAIMIRGDESRLGQCEISIDGSVQVAAFSDVINRIGGRVDLLKLDCEGGEWDIIQDVEAFQFIECVVMEYHLVKPLHSLEKLIQHFNEMGLTKIRAVANQGFGIACFRRLA